MIIGEVKNKIDKIWTDMWAGRITNPLTVDVHNKQIIYVEIDKQNQFALFIEKVEKLKTKFENSLFETELLYNSLMDKYFN